MYFTVSSKKPYQKKIKIKTLYEKMLHAYFTVSVFTVSLGSCCDDTVKTLQAERVRLCVSACYQGCVLFNPVWGGWGGQEAQTFI